MFAVVFGLAAQQTLGNVIAGLVLIWAHHFHVVRWILMSNTVTSVCNLSPMPDNELTHDRAQAFICLLQLQSSIKKWPQPPGNSCHTILRPIINSQLLPVFAYLLLKPGSLFRRTESQMVYLWIDRSKVAHWIAAHELVSTYVPATGASKWTAGQRVLADESDPKAWLELVSDDEFPLSIFYTSLHAKLDPQHAAPKVAA